PPVEEILNHLEQKIGHRFINADIAVQAMTHSSAKEKALPCNERLEFLGDSILGHVVSEYLYQKFPDYEEGELSTMKSIIVSAKTLAPAWTTNKKEAERRAARTALADLGLVTDPADLVASVEEHDEADTLE